MNSNSIFILLSAGLLIYALYKVWQLVEIALRRSASDAWVLTTGKVLFKDVEVQRGSKGSKSYIPKIRYTYTVNGERFEKTISLGTRFRESSADDALDEVGKTIEVRYNPEKPQAHISEFEKVRLSDLFPILIILIVALTFILGNTSGGTDTATGSGHYPK